MSLCFLLAAAFAIRMYNLNAPGILPEREFRAMFIARASYFNQIETIADWQREITQISVQKLGVLEPPILETLIARLYVFAGGEYIQIARIITGSFWLVGGVFIFKLISKMASSGAAIFATVYYLFLPLGVLTSRSFQPDSLMIMMFLVSLFAILRYDEQPTLFRLIGAAVIAAVTLLIKPLPIFTIFGAFIGLAIFRYGWRHFINRSFLLFTLITLAPAAIYYAYGLFGAGFLTTQAEMSFRPQLLQNREFWEGWIIVATNSVGYTALIGGLLGWLLLRNRSQQAFLTGLWIGYILFGFVFTHHIHTHNYYHLQLVVIIALSLGSLFDYLLTQLRTLSISIYRPLPIMGILILVIFFQIRDVRAGLNAPSFESSEMAQEIGEIVDHSSRLVLVSRHYGQSLEYYGYLAGTPWPKAIEYWLYRREGERELTVQERLDNLGFIPEYFIITDFNSFENRHADLKEYLNNHSTLVAATNGYLIYDGNNK